MYVPSGAFLTKGCGVHPTEIGSFEMALRAAGIAAFNLVPVSSILPPPCSIVKKSAGLKRLKSGQIVHCVLSRVASNEPGKRLSACIGLSIPSDRASYGCFFEHQTTGENAGQKTGQYAAELSAEMLATLLGVRIDPSWSPERRQKAWLQSGKIKSTRSMTQTAVVQERGMFTTVVVVAVLVP